MIHISLYYTGIGESKAVWIISTIGIATVLGRVILGYMADKSFINRLFIKYTNVFLSRIKTVLSYASDNNRNNNRTANIIRGRIYIISST